MIKEIIIKNFRSIEHTQVTFNSHLNVLIGENGTGKTNLLLALGFISTCVTHGPRRAIQNAGGLNQVFRIKERRTSKCSFSIMVLIPNRDDTHQSSTFLHGDKNAAKSPGFHVKYEFSLKYSSGTEDLSVNDETLFYGKDETCGDIIFDKSNPQNLEKKFPYMRTNFRGYDEDSLLIDRLRGSHVFLRQKISSEGKQELIEFEAALVNAFLREISNIVGFNFIPYVLRKTSDTLAPSTIGYNGESFSNVLKKILGEKHFRPLRLRRISGDSFEIKPKNTRMILRDIRASYEQILPFLKEIKPIDDIESTEVGIRFKENHLKKKFYGVNHLSDGSLKFLALCTSVSMSNYTFLYLEEIENYLNPKALSFLIGMMRDYATELNVQFLLTTHSETVLNFCKSEEVIISKRKGDGSSVYIKPKNIDTLHHELEAGGFGLGTYWGMGGIEIE